MFLFAAWLCRMKEVVLLNSLSDIKHHFNLWIYEESQKDNISLLNIYLVDKLGLHTSHIYFIYSNKGFDIGFIIFKSRRGWLSIYPVHLLLWDYLFCWAFLLSLLWWLYMLKNVRFIVLVRTLLYSRSPPYPEIIT